MSLEFSSHLEKLPHNRYINNPSCVPNIGLRQEDWATKYNKDGKEGGFRRKKCTISWPPPKSSAPPPEPVTDYVVHDKDYERTKLSQSCFMGIGSDGDRRWQHRYHMDSNDGFGLSQKSVTRDN